MVDGLASKSRPHITAPDRSHPCHQERLTPTCCGEEITTSVEMLLGHVVNTTRVIVEVNSVYSMSVSRNTP